jgi:hypothetical protein
VAPKKAPYYHTGGPQAARGETGPPTWAPDQWFLGGRFSTIVRLSSPAASASRRPHEFSAAAADAGGGKVPQVSVERQAVSGFGILRSCKTGPFRRRRRLRTLRARLAIAFRGGQVYVVGQAGVDNGNSGSERSARRC